jgi:hypothetical membrane protein
MNNFAKQDNLTVTALRFGIAVPFLYFGSQLLAAPFYPNYNFVQMEASLLGSDRSSLAMVFNVGAFLTGFAACVFAIGFLRVFSRIKIYPVLAWFSAIAVLGCGLSSFWAGIFPMPDPRHGANPFQFALFLMPFVLVVAFWRQVSFRPYFLAAVILFLGMIPVMSGLVGVDRGAFEGLLQRLLALAVFSPIAVGAFLLLQTLQSYPNPRPSIDETRAEQL